MRQGLHPSLGPRGRGFKPRLARQSTRRRGSNGHPVSDRVFGFGDVLRLVGAGERNLRPPHQLRARGRRRGRAWLPPSHRSNWSPAALAVAVAAAVAAAAHLFPEQDANQLRESHSSCRHAQAETRPVLVEPEGDRAGARASDDRGPEPPALDRQCLYESTMASIASATSPARNGIPRTKLKPVASTRNSARTSFCSWPRLISGTSTLS